MNKIKFCILVFLMFFVGCETTGKATERAKIDRITLDRLCHMSKLEFEIYEDKGEDED